MADLINTINMLIRSEVYTAVETRITEFDRLHNMSSLQWYSELCFCILTANTSAESAINVQLHVTPKEFARMNIAELKLMLKKLQYRFYNKRAEYIVKNQLYAYRLKSIITAFSNSASRRKWLVKNIKGMGYKEASHFLRNVGYHDVAIIDRHILDILYEYHYISTKKLNVSRYLNYEKTLKSIAHHCDLDLARLDLYLWYLKTHKVLK